MHRREFLLAAGTIPFTRSAVLAQERARAWRMDTLTIGAPEDVDSTELLSAGMDAAVVDLKIWPRSPDPADVALQGWIAAEAAEGSRLRIVKSEADFNRAKTEGRFAVVLTCQDASVLGNNEISYADTNLETLRYFHEQGLRVLQLTHNMRNGLGDGFQEDGDAGLSILGRAVVAEMGARGLLIDLSHCGAATTDQAIALATRPCAVTHAGCRTLFDSPRNKSDTVIRALADKGGYFGVFAMSRWLTERPVSSVEDVVDHIDHAVNVGGLETVGFGSDQPPMGDPTPQADKVAALSAYQARNLGRAGAEPLHGHVTCSDLDSPHRTERLDTALQNRGYSGAAREAVLGRNFRRVFAAACG